ncbi:MAG: hypothetical protein Q9160_002795 [Pyrenula sp. 1 TL-2023]
MSQTAILYIPPKPQSVPTSASYSPLQLISEAIYTHFSPTQLPPWSLDHRLFYDTSSLLPNSKAPRRYMQYVSLAHHPGKVYIGCTHHDVKEEPLPQDIIVVPAGLQTDDFFMVTAIRKMESLWNLRVMMKIEGGQSYELEDWKVRFGELKQSGGAQGSRSRGWIVELSCKDNESRLTGADLEADVKELWEDIGKGIDGMKLFVTRQGTSSETDKFAAVKLWMEVLRMR